MYMLFWPYLQGAKELELMLVFYLSLYLGLKNFISTWIPAL